MEHRPAGDLPDPHHGGHARRLCRRDGGRHGVGADLLMLPVDDDEIEGGAGDVLDRDRALQLRESTIGRLFVVPAVQKLVLHPAFCSFQPRLSGELLFRGLLLYYFP